MRNSVPAGREQGKGDSPEYSPFFHGPCSQPRIGTYWSSAVEPRKIFVFSVLVISLPRFLDTLCHSGSTAPAVFAIGQWLPGCAFAVSSQAGSDAVLASWHVAWSYHLGDFSCCISGAEDPGFHVIACFHVSSFTLDGRS